MNINVFFKDTKPFGQLVGLVLLILVGLIVAVGFSALLHPMTVEGDAGVRLTLLVQGLTQLLAFFVPMLLFVKLFRGSLRDELHLDFSGRKWLLGLVAVVVSLLLMPFNDWLTAWNESWQLGPMEDSMRQMSTNGKAAAEHMVSLTGGWDLALQLIVVALIPAVCEEFLFRGGLQQILQRWFGNVHVAIVVGALVFSLAHGDLYGLLPRFVLGLLLGYLFYLGGSMVVNMCVHFFNNACIVVMYWLYHTGATGLNPTDPIGFSWMIIVPCLFGAGLLFVIYFIKNRA